MERENQSSAERQRYMHRYLQNRKECLANNNIKKNQLEKKIFKLKIVVLKCFFKRVGFKSNTGTLSRGK